MRGYERLESIKNVVALTAKHDIHRITGYDRVVPSSTNDIFDACDRVAARF